MENTVNTTTPANINKMGHDEFVAALAAAGIDPIKSEDEFGRRLVGFRRDGHFMVYWFVENAFTSRPDMNTIDFHHGYSERTGVSCKGLDVERPVREYLESNLNLKFY